MRKFNRDGNKPYAGRSDGARDSGRTGDGRRSTGRNEGSYSGRSFSRTQEYSRPDRRDGERFSQRRPGTLQMHETVCDKCGKKCEVPFRPTEGKPVYCSDCFRQNDAGKSDNSSYLIKELDKVNAKLDKIMRALDID